MTMEDMEVADIMESMRVPAKPKAEAVHASTAQAQAPVVAFRRSARVAGRRV